MIARIPLQLLAVAALMAVPGPVDAQTTDRLNPMIALHEQGLPVFGMTHPALTAGRGGGGAPEAEAPPDPALAVVARETMARPMSDFEYNNYSPRSADRFMGYMAALIAAGGSVREHAFISKVPIVHGNVEAAQARIIEQLDMGHAGIFMQEVESAEEVRQAVAAMRFRSKGGIRPDEGVGLAAAYWGISREEYLERADVWPLDPDGELVVYTIIESLEGVANVREIAAEPGVTALVVGAGTLGGVFRSTGANGERVMDQAGFDAAVASVISACREFDKPCSYPANDPAEIAELMDKGFSVFTMQRRNEDGFAAIEAGRRRSGRPTGP